MAALTALISVIEIVFFAFIGDLVDWLAAADRATFLDDAWRRADRDGVGGGRRLPAGRRCSRTSSCSRRSTGTIPMLVRWTAHRYILGQSLDFFHNEFAGRVSQKVMQTALAVRETVTKVLDVGVYIVVYFIGTLYLVGRADLWLTLPLIVWLAAYIGILVDLHPAAAAHLDEPGRRAGADDRPHRRQLHQHPDHQALRPHAPRAGLCPRRDGRVPGRRSTGRGGCSPRSRLAPRCQLAPPRRDRRRRDLRLAAESS